MKLNESPFKKVASGRKTMELRLYDDKRRLLNISDRIIFTNIAKPTQKIAVIIKSLHRYASFEELLAEIPLEKLGNDTEETPESVAHAMKKYYTDDQIKRYGVLGIGIEIIDTEETEKQKKEQEENKFERMVPDETK